jgi:hypothetical protein
MAMMSAHVQTISAGLVAVVSGCAGAPVLPAHAVEAAYVEARAAQAVCRSRGPACCGEQAAEARAAAGRGDSARAAHLWQEVALSCPGRRAEATAAMMADHGAAVGPSSRSESTPRVLNVSYRTRLSPAVRLYWVATAVGARLLPSTGPSPATQAVQVEVQAIRFTGTRPGPLLVVDRRFDLAFQPGVRVTVEIAEAPAGSASPLEVSAHVDRAPLSPSPGPPPSAPRKAHTARLEKARTIHLDPPRAPLEFGALSPGSGPALRLCLDREGQLDTIRFLETPHPRLAASLIDMFRDSQHEPYRVNDLPVPSCEVIRPSPS